MHEDESKQSNSCVADRDSVAALERTPWQRVLICRHLERPHTIHYLEKMCDSFTEMHGDRLFGDDPAIMGGIGYIGGKKFMIIGQERGYDTQGRLKRNFGMPHPEGYRKALRLMELAEKFGLPILTLIDTPGAYPGLSAEERGQGWAIAANLLRMARLKTPLISVLIGEGCSGGALGIGVTDVIGMLEHSYYSVISPEGCASILWKEPKMKEHAASILKIHAEDLLESGMVDEIIPEPEGGAHLDPAFVFTAVRNFILREVERLSLLSTEELLEARYNKFRVLGAHSEVIDEGIESERQGERASQ